MRSGYALLTSIYFGRIDYFSYIMVGEAYGGVGGDNAGEEIE